MKLQMSIAIHVEGSPEDSEAAFKLNAQIEELMLGKDLDIEAEIDLSLAADIGKAMGEFINSMESIGRRANAIKPRRKS